MAKLRPRLHLCQGTPKATSTPRSFSTLRSEALQEPKRSPAVAWVLFLPSKGYTGLTWELWPLCTGPA